MSKGTPIEGIGTFYLGRLWDQAAGAVSNEPLLYDAADLRTHAVCLGMTGSGKTGLCVDLIEEAALDGVPAIVIDRKGDLANLALTFPALTPADFEPWIDAGEARAAGETPAAFAAAVATRWKQGLAASGQDGARIARLRASAQVALFTPASEVGTPISILGTLSAPPPALRARPELMRERVQDTVAGLLSLLGIEADPLRSREHVFLSLLVDEAWRAGEALGLASLITGIQNPPFTKVGVLDLEAFYPAKARFELVLALNNLLAAPGFAAWRMGEPLEIPRLLHAPDGRPRISIVSLAHLGEKERVFFLTLLLSSLVAWMRTQPGTGSLRALLVIDEVAGLLPPTANPPTKGPLLTLLKQARAYGLGLLLATQNPVDLDYKALSNAGTWLLGRLATKQDQARVLDGLEQAGAGLDRAAFARTLARLPKRCFVLRNVHEDRPVVFQSRFALSYLRGPLTRPGLLRLKEKGLVAASAQAPAPLAVDIAVAANARTASTQKHESSPPLPAEGFEVGYLQDDAGPAGEPRVLTPWILAEAHLHFVRARAKVDTWSTCLLLVPPSDGPEPAWAQAQLGEAGRFPLGTTPPENARFAPLFRMLTRPKAKKSLEKKIAAWLYRSQRVRAFRCAPLKLRSTPEETREAFASRVALVAREKREAKTRKLKARLARRFDRLQAKIAATEARVDRESDQLRYAESSRSIQVGTTLLGALFGRKTFSRSTVGRAGTAMRAHSRVTREREDVKRVEAKLAAQKAELAALDTEAKDALSKLVADFEARGLPEIREEEIPPRKADIDLVRLAVVWRQGLSPEA